MKTFALATLAFAANAYKLSAIEQHRPAATVDKVCKGDVVCAFDFYFYALDDNIDGNISIAEFS